MSATLSAARALKVSLSKEVSRWAAKEHGEEKTEGNEALDDVLDRLGELDVTVEVLADTLIGTVVSKLKSHPRVGDKARSLIKKWKAVAKKESSSSDRDGSSAPKQQPTAVAAAAKRTSSASATASKPPPPSIRSEQPPLERRDSGGLFDPSDYWSDLPSNRQNVCQKFYEILMLAKPRVLAVSSSSGGKIHADALPFLVAQRASEIEQALHDLHLGPEAAASGGGGQSAGPKAYADKARSLAFNFKKNAELSASVVLGDDDCAEDEGSTPGGDGSGPNPPPPSGIGARELVRMTSEQLASDQVRTARAREAQKVIEGKRLDWEQANEDRINEMCGIKGELLRASLFTCSRCKSTKTTSTQKQTRSADEPMTVFVLCMNCGKRWKC
jgi:transcription elongation factor S-II